MKHFKTLAVAALLAATAGAHAKTYLPMDPGAPGQFFNTWSFTSGPQTSGQSFDDFYQFNVPDTESVSFYVGGLGNTPTVDFNGGGYALSVVADGTLLALNPVSDDVYSLAGGYWALTSGVYELEVAGTFIADGAYSGQITGQPLPEPADLLLAVTALGAMLGAGRLRKRKA